MAHGRVGTPSKLHCRNLSSSFTHCVWPCSTHLEKSRDSENCARDVAAVHRWIYVLRKHLSVAEFVGSRPRARARRFRHPRVGHTDEPRHKCVHDAWNLHAHPMFTAPSVFDFVIFSSNRTVLSSAPSCHVNRFCTECTPGLPFQDSIQRSLLGNVHRSRVRCRRSGPARARNPSRR